MIRWLVGILVAGLFAVLFYQWHDWSQASAVAAYLKPAAVQTSGPDVATGPLPSVDAPGPLDDFMEVIERPLFNKDRRPPPEEAETVQEAVVTGRPQVQLSGIVATQGTYKAHIRPPKGETLIVAVGDDYEGWQVAEIMADRIILLRDGRREEFDLRPPPEPPPVRPSKARPKARPRPRAARARAGK